MTLRADNLWAVLREGGRHFAGNHGLVFSASVAFNLLLSAVPILFLAFAAASRIIGTNNLPFAQLAELLRSTFPYGAQVLVPSLEGLIHSGKALGLLGSILLLLASFSATEAVHTSLGVMLGISGRKPFRVRAAFHVLFVSCLTLLTFAAILVPPMWKGISLLTQGFSAEIDTAFQVVLQTIADLVLAGALFAGGMVSYRYMAPRPVSWKNVLPGSLLLLVLLYGIRWGFTFYIRKFSKLNLIYGSLFSIVCFIIVAYLFAAAYLFCACIIGVLEREGGSEGSPEEGSGAANS
ncbi:MAG: hypothetical protein Kow00128_20070 [Deltaproteobacteria bacterium]